MRKSKQRFVVGDLGFAWAVFDTAVHADYEFEAGKDAPHPSTNLLNSRRVDIFATREEAVRRAEELNASEGRGRAAS